MANDFLLKKWKAIFHENDINKDNVITIEDAELFTDRFAAHHKFDAEHTAVAKEKYRYFWREFFLKGQDTITEKMFTDTLTEEYNTDPVKFQAKMQSAMATVADILDVNQDGQISEQELEVCMKSAGVDQTFDQKYVQAFPQRKPGFVNIDDFTECWVEYMCNNDNSVVTKEKPASVAVGVLDIEEIYASAN